MAWTTTSSLTEAKRSLAGCGTTSAALCFGGDTGDYVDTTEIWSGTAWATTTSLTEAKDSLAGCGTTSAALCFGGETDSNIFVSTTGIWSGTAWATTTSLTEEKKTLAGCGTTSAALCFGGYTGVKFSTTEIWSGTAWATTTALPTEIYSMSGCGTTSAALCFGTYTHVSETLIWSGTAWATTSSLTEAKWQLAGCGTISAALCFGGNTGAISTISTTEIWSGTAWATTSALTETKRLIAGCGSVSAALCFGGYADTFFSTTEIWSIPPPPTLLEDLKTNIRSRGFFLQDTKTNIQAGSEYLQDLKSFADADYLTEYDFLKTDTIISQRQYEDVKTFIGLVDHETGRVFLKADIQGRNWFREDLKVFIETDYLWSRTYLKTDIRAAKWYSGDLKISLESIFEVFTGIKTEIAATLTADTTPPYVERYPNPYDGDTNVERDAPVLFYVRDDGWGVDIDSIWVEIDGVKYQNGDPEFAYTGSPNSYKVIVRPINDWAYNQIITVRIFGKDLAGNPGLDLEPI